MQYDLVILGNYTKDTIVSPSGTRSVDGGGFNYGAHVAAMMGLKTAAVTRLAREDVRVVEALYRAVFGRSVALMSHFLDVNLYAHAYYDVCRDELVPLERRACPRRARR